MADYRAGDAVALEFRVLDLAGAARTGLTAGDFTISLSERTTGSYSSSGETTSITERGSGWYTLSFTLDSDADQRTYAAEVVEDAGAQNTHRFFFTVGDITNQTESDAWCSVNDVEAKLQRGGRTSSTKPTEAQTIDFMAWRAAELQLMIEPIHAVTVASGSNPIGTSADNDIALERLLRHANATAAAGDVVMAAMLAERGTIPDQAVVYYEDYKRQLEQIDLFLRRSYASQVARTGSSQLQGDDDRMSLDTVF